MWNLLLGVTLGTVFSPQLRKVAEPVVLEVLKAGIKVGDEIKRVSAEIGGELSELVAKAEAEVHPKVHPTEPAPAEHHAAPTDSDPQAPS